jgi:SAM-dependent methyltransferase
VIEKRLTPEDILASYDLVSKLYPHLPSLSLWRAWEHAAYQGLLLREPVLDVGCGDGQFFSLLWPTLKTVVGVDHDPHVAAAARNTGVYREVHVASADRLPLASNSMDSAFANCSLEHMDRLPAVLRSIHRALRPGSPFLLSVVTDKFSEWRTLSLLLRQVGELTRAESVDRDFDAYHHLVNPLPPDGWATSLEDAGFRVDTYVPIVPELTTRLFLFVDQVWHLRQAHEEAGTHLYDFLRSLPRFDTAFRQVLAGFMEMERDWTTTSGAVFVARREN